MQYHNYPILKESITSYLPYKAEQWETMHVHYPADLLNL